MSLAATLSPTPSRVTWDASATLPAGEMTDRELPRLPVVSRGEYEVGKELARGGLGKILVARDRRLDRLVAVKVLHHQGGPDADRFLREAFLTARLQHPGIVPIYEAGVWPDGEPFYAMRLVSGQPLHEAIAARPTLNERLALVSNVITAASAVAYAHDQGIVHRDIKPHNVLVGELGETVVIDWGLAKDLRASDQPDVGPIADQEAFAGTDGSLTRAGAVLGTPAYMAPEQGRGEPCDERTDVYALGALLYHVLSGVAPYGGAPFEILANLLDGSPVALRDREPGVPRELLAIVVKAMARDPELRYRTAKQLADDLQKFQTGQLVEAHRYRPLERVARVLRRHRAAVAVAIVATVVLTVALLLSFRRILGEERVAGDRADDLTLISVRSLVDRDPPRALELLAELSPRGNWGAARVLSGAVLAHAPPRTFVGYLNDMRDAQISQPIAATERLVAFRRVDHSIEVIDLPSASHRTLPGSFESVAFSPDQTLLATLGKELAVWDAACLARWVNRGAECRPWTIDARAEALPTSGYRLVFSRDGRIAWAARSAQIHVANLTDHVVIDLVGHEGAVTGLGFTRGNVLVSSARDATVRTWNVDARTSSVLPGTHKMVWRLSVTPDGNHVIAAGLDPFIAIWDLATSGDPITIPVGDIDMIAFSADSSQIAYVGFDDKLRIVKLADAERIAFAGHENVTHAVAFSPDGKSIASGGQDTTIRIWNLTTGRSRVLAGHTDAVTWLGFISNDTVLSASADGTVRSWSLTPGEDIVAADRPTVYVTHAPRVSLAFSPDSRRLAYITLDRAVAVRELSDGVTSILADPRPTVTLAFAGDGSRLAVGGEGGDVAVWSGATRREVGHHDAAVTALAFSPDGHWLASGSRDGSIELVDTTREAPPRRLVGHRREIRRLAFSSDGRLASASEDRSITVWDVTTGTGPSTSHDNSAYDLMFDRTANRFVATVGEKVVLLERQGVVRSVPVGALMWGLVQGTGFVVAGSRAGIRILDVESGSQRALDVPDDVIVDLALWQDKLATASSQGVIRLWDLASGESRVLGIHDGPAYQVELSPNGTRVASAGLDGTVRIWRDDLPVSPTALKATLRRGRDAWRGAQGRASASPRL